MNICWAVDKQLGDRIFVLGGINEPLHKKINKMLRRKQRHRSASQLITSLFSPHG